MLPSRPLLDMGTERLYYCGPPDDAIRKVTEVQPSMELEAYLRSELPPDDNTPIKDIGMIWHEDVRIWLVDSVGLLLKGFLEHEGLIDVHVAFWDKRLRGREAMCRAMAQNAARESGYHGVWTAIPMKARATIAFAKRIGFRQERVTNGIVIFTLVT